MGGWHYALWSEELNVQCHAADGSPSNGVSNLAYVTWSDLEGTRWIGKPEDDPEGHLVTVLNMDDGRVQIIMQGRPVDQPDAEVTQHHVVMRGTRGTWWAA